MLSNFLRTFQQWLWAENTSFLKTRRVLQIILLMIHCITEDSFRERAQALAYTTILSLVPLLAVSFSLLKGFGAHFELEPWLLSIFSPLGDGAQTTVDTLISFVERVNASFLGGIGLIFLFYTVISLLSSIENAFNTIWQVDKGRDWHRRVSDYLIVVLTGPVLFFTAISIFSNQWINYLLQHLQGSTTSLEIMGYSAVLMTLLLLTLAFTFAYVFMTHRRVKILPALCGGFFAALTWSIIGKIFATFVAGSNNYSGIYSGFAGVIVFVLWTYISWLIILLGNQLAYLIQTPSHAKEQNNVLTSDQQQFRIEIIVESTEFIKTPLQIDVHKSPNDENIIQVKIK